jgi:hypothetical protein
MSEREKERKKRFLRGGVCEREKEREREKYKERERERKKIRLSD